MKNVFTSLCIGLNKLCGRSATTGEKLEPLSITIVEPQTQLNYDQWIEELKVGKTFTSFKPYGTGETLEEMELRHKKEVILEAQQRHFSEQLKYTF